MRTKHYLIAATIFCIPIIAYIINFHNHPISNDPADWGTFGDYMTGTLGVVGLVVGYAITEASLIKQEKTLRPLAYITVGDYENQLSVGIKNEGLGPLLIKNVRVTNLQNKIHNNLIEWMPQLPQHAAWTQFIGNIEGTVIKEGNEIIILEITQENINSPNPEFTYEEFQMALADVVFAPIRDEIRQSLSQLTIEIEYEDIYGKVMPKAMKNLEWFSRNL